MDKPTNSSPFLLRRQTWKDIVDLDDLGDYVEIMRGTVNALKATSESGETLCVSTTQLMTEFVFIEESLWIGLHSIMKLACTDEEQETLLQLTEHFSVLSADFQDTWDSETWESYNFIRSTVDTHRRQREEQLYVLDKAKAQADAEAELRAKESLVPEVNEEVKRFDVGVETEVPEAAIEGKRCQVCRVF